MLRKLVVICALFVTSIAHAQVFPPGSSVNAQEVVWPTPIPTQVYPTAQPYITPHPTATIRAFATSIPTQTAVSIPATWTPAPTSTPWSFPLTATAIPTQTAISISAYPTQVPTQPFPTAIPYATARPYATVLPYATAIATQTPITFIDVTNALNVKYFTWSLVGTGTTTIATATGNVLVKSVSFYQTSAAIGLISASAATNDTTSVALLSSITLLNLTAGKNLGALNSPFILANGRAVVGTTVGVGSSGSMLVAVEYYKGLGDIS